MLQSASLSLNDKQAIDELKKRLLSHFAIIEMKIFGSKARGDSTPDSDIDLMIKLDERDYKVESEIFSIIYDINLEYDVFICPFFISQKQIIDGPLSESPIYKAIEREGLSL